MNNPHDEDRPAPEPVKAFSRPNGAASAGSPPSSASPPDAAKPPGGARNLLAELANTTPLEQHPDYDPSTKRLRLRMADGSRFPTKAESDLRRAIDASGLSRRYRDARLTPDVPPGMRGDEWANYRTAQRVLAAAVDDSEQGLTVVIWGERGRGKTWLASGAVRRACAIGRSARIAYAREVSDEIKRTFGDDGGSSVDVRSAWTRPDVIVLDEMNERNATVWENGELTYLLNKRDAELRTSILIGSWATEKVARASLGDTIVRRVEDHGGFLHADWPRLTADLFAAEGVAQ